MDVELIALACANTSIVILCPVHGEKSGVLGDAQSGPGKNYWPGSGQGGQVHIYHTIGNTAFGVEQTAFASLSQCQHICKNTVKTILCFMFVYTHLKHFTRRKIELNRALE